MIASPQSADRPLAGPTLSTKSAVEGPSVNPQSKDPVIDDQRVPRRIQRSGMIAGLVFFIVAPCWLLLADRYSAMMQLQRLGPQTGEYLLEASMAQVYLRLLGVIGAVCVFFIARYLACSDDVKKQRAERKRETDRLRGWT